MVTAQYLVEGAFYAAEQCGFLLRDAVVLYNRKAYASAVVLAAFAREELGRSRILRDLHRKMVKDGQAVTIKDIQNKCQDHVTKQQWAQLSITQRFSGDEGLGRLLRTRARTGPQSEAFKEADKRLTDITKRQKKRTPDDRHKARQSALYVEPDETGTRWNRPKETLQENARKFLEDTANDYGPEYYRLQQGQIERTDWEFAKALREWVDRPELPSPERPAFITEPQGPTEDTD
ncbi:MAG: AbiV family abortive infection protein [Deltaproteobacteria bacterium]|nr:AbiV family abortive infection protein [Deltaproteobacteria bacterium]